MRSYILSVSVRELIEFVYVTGDLRFSVSSSNRMLQGAEGHRTIQKNRKENWTNELYVKHEQEWSRVELSSDDNITEDPKPPEVIAFPLNIRSGDFQSPQCQ